MSLYHPSHTVPYDFQPFYDIAAVSPHVVFTDDKPRCLTYDLLAPTIFTQCPMDYPLIIIKDGINREFKYENPSAFTRLHGVKGKFTEINGFPLRIYQVAACIIRGNILQSSWVDLPAQFEFIANPGYKPQSFLPGFH